MSDAARAWLIIAGLVLVAWVHQGTKHEPGQRSRASAVQRAAKKPSSSARTPAAFPTARPQSDALRIQEVTWEPAENFMNTRTRMIIAKVKNTSPSPQDLWIGSRDGLKMFPEELRLKKWMWETERRGGEPPDEFSVKEEELQMPFGLGIDARSSPSAPWHTAASMWIWIPSEQKKGNMQRVEQIRLQPGETRSFSLRINAAGEIMADHSFRVFIVSPDFKHVDEKVYSPESPGS
jgi:hypothetical protein